MSFLLFIILVGIVCAIAGVWILLISYAAEWIEEIFNWSVAFIFVVFMGGISAGIFIFAGSTSLDEWKSIYSESLSK